MCGKEQLSEVIRCLHSVATLEFQKLTLIFISGWKSRDSVPRLVEDYLAKKVKVDEFVSHDVPFEEINKAFHLMHSGQR